MFGVGLKQKHMHLGSSIPSFLREEGDRAADTAADGSF